MVVTRRLLIFIFVSLVIIGGMFAASMSLFDEHLWISGLCLECGIIGGFVSIQQRLHTVGDEELGLLAESWYSILLVPIYGGIFALVLYLIFLSGLIQGQLFPLFDMPVFHSPATDADIQALLNDTVPKSGGDFAKLLFWCFVAGFSERFVPQIIQRVSKSVTADGDASGSGQG